MWEATKPLAPVNRTRGPCPFDMVVKNIVTGSALWELNGVH